MTVIATSVPIRHDQKADWYLLRTKGATVTDDDTDHVSAQTDFYADVSLLAELLPVGYPGMTKGRNSAPPTKLQIVGVWLDSGGDVITPTAGSGRGEFDITLVKVLRLINGAGDAVTVLSDSEPLTGCVGYKVNQFDGMSGEPIWARLTNITAPTGGVSLQLWAQTVI